MAALIHQLHTWALMGQTQNHSEKKTQTSGQTFAETETERLEIQSIRSSNALHHVP